MSTDLKSSTPVIRRTPGTLLKTLCNQTCVRMLAHAAPTLLSTKTYACSKSNAYATLQILHPAEWSNCQADRDMQQSQLLLSQAIASRFITVNTSLFAILLKKKPGSCLQDVFIWQQRELVLHHTWSQVLALIRRLYRRHERHHEAPLPRAEQHEAAACDFFFFWRDGVALCIVFWCLHA